MIKPTEDKKVVVVDDGESAKAMRKYRIADDDASVAHIGALLENVYKHPERAVVREYVANAVDAHVLAKTDAKIKVGIPTTLNPVFTVRDFGPGLSLESAESLLCSYGASGAEKRASNDFIGGFGIGAKCAYAVSKTFTYTIWHGGRKRVWLCTKDELDRSQSAMVSDEESSEPTGVLVSIPMTPNSFSIRAAFGVLSFMERFSMLEFDPPNLGPQQAPTPLLTLDAGVTGALGEIPVRIDVHSKDATKYGKPLYGENLPAILLGDYLYTIDDTVFDAAWDKLRRRSDLDIDPLVDNLIRSVVVQMPTGTIQVAPARESLLYSERTRGLVSAIATLFASPTFLDALKAQALEQMAGDSIRAKRQKLLALGLPQEDTDWNLRGGLALPADQLLFEQTVDISKFERYGHRKVSSVRQTATSWGESDAGTGRQRMLLIPGSWGIDDAGLEDIRVRGRHVFRQLKHGVVVVPVDKEPKYKEVTTIAKKVAVLKDRNDDQITNLHVVVLKVADRASVPWLNDGSVEVVEMSALPNNIFPGMFASRARSSRATSPVSPPRARCSGSLLRFDRHANGGRGSDASYFAPVEQDGTGMPTSGILFFADDRLEWIYSHETDETSKLHPNTLASFINALVDGGAGLDAPSLLKTFPKLLDFSSSGRGIYVTRLKHADKVTLDPSGSGLESLLGYLRRRFVEDVVSGDLDFESLVRRVANHERDDVVGAVFREVHGPAMKHTRAQKLLQSYEARQNTGDQTTLLGWERLFNAMPDAIKRRLPGGEWSTSSTPLLHHLAKDVRGIVRRCPKAQSMGRWLLASERPPSWWLLTPHVCGDAEYQNPLEEIVAQAYEEIPYLAARVELQLENPAKAARNVDGKLTYVDFHDTYKYDGRITCDRLVNELFGEDAAAVKRMQALIKQEKQHRKTMEETK